MRRRRQPHDLRGKVEQGPWGEVGGRSFERVQRCVQASGDIEPAFDEGATWIQIERRRQRRAQCERRVDAQHEPGPVGAEIGTVPEVDAYLSPEPFSEQCTQNGERSSDCTVRTYSSHAVHVPAPPVGSRGSSIFRSA